VRRTLKRKERKKEKNSHRFPYKCCASHLIKKPRGGAHKCRASDHIKEREKQSRVAISFATVLFVKESLLFL
jgi:hypothetical protein